MITTEQVKTLRDQTGVSVMQCKKALEETNGDLEKALVILRKKGTEIAAKKADRSAADGLIVTRAANGKALTLILNCETDFVARNEGFVVLANTLADIAVQEGAAAAQEKAPALISDVVLKIGENIQLGSIDELAGPVVNFYTHHTGKVGAVVVLSVGTEALAKDIAMHITAMKPTYLSEADIPASAKESVLEVFKKEVDESGKPEEVKAKMLEGKIATYFKEQTLLDQPFFKDGDKSIAQLLKDNGNAAIITYRLYTVG
ncbi:MAG TPA: translation elongation factor Ts [Candidatus Paceibacterota bacterium]|nr:translation elongation factor Ts [Candidatus Paceibacterota bacterium]